jgi:hypothetical protein
MALVSTQINLKFPKHGTDLNSRAVLWALFNILHLVNSRLETKMAKGKKVCLLQHIQKCGQTQDAQKYVRIVCSKF